jgi:hypothetical protein
MVCGWYYMHGANLPPPLPEPPSKPLSPAYFAQRGSDRRICPTCDKHLKRKQLRNHIVRAYKNQDAAELSKLLSLTLHGSLPGGIYWCPLYTFFAKDRLLFTKRFMFHYGPMPPDTSTPVKKIRIVKKIECSTSCRPTATTHVRYHHRFPHAGHDIATTGPAPPTDDTATTQSTTRPTTAPRIQACPACSPELSTTPGLLYHVRTHHLDIACLRVIDERGSPKCIPFRPKLRLFAVCPAAYMY